MFEGEGLLEGEGVRDTWGEEDAGAGFEGAVGAAAAAGVGEAPMRTMSSYGFHSCVIQASLSKATKYI